MAGNTVNLGSFLVSAFVLVAIKHIFRLVGVNVCVTDKDDGSSLGWNVSYFAHGSGSEILQ